MKMKNCGNSILKRTSILTAGVVFIAMFVVSFHMDYYHVKHCHRDGCVKCGIILIGENISNSLKNTGLDTATPSVIFSLVSFIWGIILILQKRTPVVLKSRIDI